MEVAKPVDRNDQTIYSPALPDSGTPLPDLGAAPPDPLVRLEHVSKTFLDIPGGLAALDDISLTLDAGQFVAISGPSGCGKSTLLRILADLVTPSSGLVRVCSHAPAEARRRREIGVVFQAPVLYGWRTVRANVALPLVIAGVHGQERDLRVAQMLALVGLEESADRNPRQLSGGMQQRAAMARALVLRPRLLLMDEPFGALDEVAREGLNQELLRVRRETGVTVLFVTHDIEEAVFLADRVVVLTPRPGRVAADIPIPLPRPRDAATRLDPEYFRAVNEVRAVLRRESS